MYNYEPSNVKYKTHSTNIRTINYAIVTRSSKTYKFPETHQFQRPPDRFRSMQTAPHAHMCIYRYNQQPSASTLNNRTHLTHDQSTVISPDTDVPLTFSYVPPGIGPQRRRRRQHLSPLLLSSQRRLMIPEPCGFCRHSTAFPFNWIAVSLACSHYFHRAESRPIARGPFFSPPRAHNPPARFVFLLVYKRTSEVVDCSPSVYREVEAAARQYRFLRFRTRVISNRPIDARASVAGFLRGIHAGMYMWIWFLCFFFFFI